MEAEAEAEEYLKAQKRYELKLKLNSKFLKGQVIELMNDFAQSQLEGFNFCPHCGYKLEHKISTDANTDKVCKSVLCKKTKT